MYKENNQERKKKVEMEMTVCTAVVVQHFLLRAVHLFCFWLRNDILYMSVNVERSMDEIKVFQTVLKLHKYHHPEPDKSPFLMNANRSLDSVTESLEYGSRI